MRSGAAVDTDAPVLASLAMTPTTVDTSSGPAVITITARLTDERSPSIGGTRAAQPDHPDRSGRAQQATAYVSQAQRISGTATDGVYRSTLTIPGTPAPGPWNASAVLSTSPATPATLTTANLAAAGFPSRSNQTGPGDTHAPQLVALGSRPRASTPSLQSATSP